MSSRLRFGAKVLRDVEPLHQSKDRVRTALILPVGPKEHKRKGEGSKERQMTNLRSVFLSLERKMEWEFPRVYFSLQNSETID